MKTTSPHTAATAWLSKLSKGALIDLTWNFVMTDRDKILGLTGTFTWGFSSEFFIETSDGNFIWDKTTNVLRFFQGEYTDWLFMSGIPYGRDKGKSTIRGYCGDKVLISNEAL